MSAVGGRADLPRTWPDSLLLIEALGEEAEHYHEKIIDNSAVLEANALNKLDASRLRMAV